jgi:hypothetical protein
MSKYHCVRSVQACWDDVGRVNIGEDWEQKIFSQTWEAHKEVDLLKKFA